MLPSKYIPAYSIRGENCYFDTGIVAKSTQDITGLFNTGASPHGYCFGARNTASTSSAAQLNFLAIDGTSYIGYASARLTLNENPISGTVSFLKKGREFTVLTSTSIFNKTGAATTFTGTRPIFLLALNNAGSPSYGTTNYTSLIGFKIEDGNEKHEFLPVYNTETQEFGVYDLETDNFISKSGTGTLDPFYLLTVTSSNGGSAFAENQVVGNVKEQYYSNGIKTARLKAIPDRNYSFLNWTVNGEVVSTDEETTYTVSQDTTIVANFRKNVDFQYSNKFQLLGLQYGVGSIQNASDPNARDSDIYTNVRSFSIKVDGLAKATSTIECESIPSLYQIDMPVFLISPKGKIVYYGVIKAIKDKTLTCREPMAILDHDFLFLPTTSVDGDNLTNRNILYASSLYLNDVRMGYCTAAGTSVTSGYPDSGLQRNMRAFIVDSDRRVLYNSERNTYVSMPLTTEYEVKNLEDYYFDLFEQFAVYLKPAMFLAPRSTLYYEKGDKRLMQLQVKNTKEYETLVISDNIEAITNVTVDLSEVSTTMLQIFNSTGKTFRGVYGMTKDGVIEENPETGSTIPQKFIARDTYKMKLVRSDDKINTIVEQNLSGALYNHKISFNVDLTYDIYRLDDFQIGRKVDFYYKNKLYKSDVTAVEFSLDSDMTSIVSAKITLGNVRNKLTTKLNIGKSKRK